MDISEIEAKIKEIRDGSLKLLCLMPSGKTRTLTVRECIEAKAKYVHVVVDQLDELLGRELGGDAEYP